MPACHQRLSIRCTHNPLHAEPSQVLNVRATAVIAELGPPEYSCALVRFRGIQNLCRDQATAAARAGNSVNC